MSPDPRERDLVKSEDMRIYAERAIQSPSPGEYRVLYDEQPPGDASIPDDLPPPDPCDRPWSPEP